MSLPLLCLTVCASVIAIWAHALTIGEFYRRRRRDSAGSFTAPPSRSGEAPRSLAGRRESEPDHQQSPRDTWGPFAGTQAVARAGLSVHDVAAMFTLELMAEAQSL